MGVYYPKNTEKFLGDHIPIFRSSWESRMMYFLDNNPNVLKWASEAIAVPYLSPKDGKIHTYYVDFYVEIATRNDVKKLLIEVKPKKKLLPPKTTNRSRKTVATETMEYYINMAKWQSAQAFANKNGMEWNIYTEDDIEMHC